jgi:hypothetical protein
MKAHLLGILGLTLVSTGVLLAQQGPIICNNREARLGPCVPNADCSPARPDPDANPPVECGGLTVQIIERIIRCQGGPAGGHCRDLYSQHCANKQYCTKQRFEGQVVCRGDKSTTAGISGWRTDIEIIPCVIREPSL